MPGAGGGRGQWVTPGSIAPYQVEYMVPQRPQGTGSRTATAATCKLINSLCLSISSSRHKGSICLSARKRFALSCVSLSTANYRTHFAEGGGLKPLGRWFKKKSNWAIKNCDSCRFFFSCHVTRQVMIHNFLFGC